LSFPSGNVTVIAATGSARSAVLPQVPTFEELGVSGFTRSSWVGLFLPAATPKEIVQKLVNDVNEALATPAVSARLTALGTQPAGGTSDAFEQQVKDDFVYYRSLIQQANVKLD
jgi:tripartite-type tricarboxylate transporter receptor subunit TctC